MAADASQKNFSAFGNAETGLEELEAASTTCIEEADGQTMR